MEKWLLIIAIAVLPLFWMANGAQADNTGDQLVNEGVTASGVLFEPTGWNLQGNLLKNTRDGLELNAEALYSTAQFKVVLELTLEHLGGTKVSVATGNITWTLDDTDGNLMVQGRDFKPIVLGKATDFITSGKSFRCVITGMDTDRKMRMFIDDRLVGEVTYLVNRTLGFGIRTGSNRVGIRTFVINGEASHGDSAAPVAASLARLGQDYALRLPRWKGGKGTFKARLEGAALEVVVTENGQTSFSASVLERAYSTGQGGAFRVHSALLEVATPTDVYQCRLMIDDSSRQTDFPDGKVEKTTVGNRLVVNGMPWNFYQSHWDYNGRQVMERAYSPDDVKRFAEVGFKGSLLILAPYKYMGADDFDCEGFIHEFEEIAGRVIAENPEAMFEIQFFLFTPTEWNERHEDELIVLDNGVKKLAHAYRQELQPSYASPSWRRDMGKIVRQSVEAMRRSPYGDRIGTFRLLYANCGEWNHWGYHEQAYVDFSKPMQRAFGMWLRKKYGHEAALRRAWGRDNIGFDAEDLVPSRENRLSGGDIFRGNGTATMQSVDYYTFFQEFAVETIEHFAKIAKEASGNRLLVGSYYGYYHGHYYANPYHFQDSGHYATWRMLQSPYIDFFGGPSPYSRRDIMLCTNGLAASIALHGKLWICEGDTRTHRAVAKATPHMGITEVSQSETIAMLLRDYIAMSSRQTTTYLYDFISGWYRDEPTLATIRRIHQLDEARLAMKEAAPSVAEVAIIYSEASIPYVASRHAAAMVGEKIGPASMDYWGVPVDDYLESDLESIDFSRYKVVIFANIFLYTGRIQNMIDTKVARDGRCLVFFSTPGVVGEDNCLHPENCEKLTGIPVELEEPSVGKPLDTLWHKGTCRNHYTRFAHIKEEGPRALAHYSTDQKVAIAECMKNGSRRILCCHPFPDAIVMRDLLAKAKVHVYTSGKSGLPAFYMAKPYIGVFSRRGGVQVVTLKEPAEIVVDLMTGEVLGENTARIEFTMPKNASTVLLYAGAKEDYRKIPQK